MPVSGFKWTEDLKRYNEKRKEGYFYKFFIQYPENLYDVQNDLPLLPERIKTEKVKKLLADLHDKIEYVISNHKFKASIKSWVSLKKNIESFTVIKRRG